MTARALRVLVGTPHPARDPFLDNARFAVMVLVVAGHAMTRIRGVDGVLAGYVWIYAFHMPLFVLLSGYAAASYRGEPRQVRRMVTTLIWPLLLVGFALHAQQAAIHDRPLLDGYSPLDAPWLLWFIAALLLWRLTTPIWLALRFPVTTAVLISLASGIFPVPGVLGLDKAMAFLPFYVLGLTVVRRRHFDQLTRPVVRALAAVTVAASFVVVLTQVQGWEIRWFYWIRRYSSPALDVDVWTGMGIRLAMIVGALVLSAAVLALIPQRRAWFSALGANTLYAYLLHGFLIRFAADQGWFADARTAGVAGAVMVVAISAAVAVVLMSRPVARLFRPLFEPRAAWLFRPETTSAERRAVVERQ
ncbi:fucose 4-O-acetylase-like acetyltransferase [Nocardioides massiliensis]|uniref:Fucose 4-O-acetylase-like acetyltransferase n=2 Tax=Nocardioides massiliensis TaxID=1325935 RepID=A0ABT9NNJ5_9ACTN|nr:acyltransferase family protein [Nocardioides massiliensis]MDP9821996.1 fucose 4-O-acetylase-like acetyltransferase [Nocardioides massiliensis]